MVNRPSSTGSVWKSNARGASPHPLVDLGTGLNDVVPFELAHLSNVLLRRHRFQIIHEARVDMRVEVHILGLVRGALRRVVLGDPKPIKILRVEPGVGKQTVS